MGIALLARRRIASVVGTASLCLRSRSCDADTTGSGRLFGHRFQSLGQILFPSVPDSDSFAQADVSIGGSRYEGNYRGLQPEG